MTRTPVADGPMTVAAAVLPNDLGIFMSSNS